MTYNMRVPSCTYRILNVTVTIERFSFILSLPSGGGDIIPSSPVRSDRGYIFIHRVYVTEIRTAWNNDEIDAGREIPRLLLHVDVDANPPEREVGGISELRNLLRGG